MQAHAGKEELFTAVSLMQRTSDRWLLQQPMTSNSKPFPARRVTPTRLLSANRAASSDDSDIALQVESSGGHAISYADLIAFARRSYSIAYFNRCPKLHT
jgi:hypothetical protein